MTFTTLQYNGVEMALADWDIGSAVREVSNQAHDHFACDMMIPADTSPDPIPYGSQIILRIGRVTNTAIPPSGLPPAGASGFSGGQTWFVGWRVEEFRTGSPSLEKLDFKFAGPWEFFFERLVFQKLWFTWNGTANVADWRSQVVLGQSVNAETGPNDPIPDSNATNLMSIRQQVAEIIAYVVAQTTTDYGSAQVQSDNLTAEIDGVNYDLYASPGANLLIPDYIAGTYAVSGKTSAQTGANAANMQTVLRAPLEAVNDITCAEAMRKMLKWVGPMGTAMIWFDYTTTSGGNPCPTLHIGTRDQLPSITLPMVGQNAGFKIKRRDDLIPGCIALKFRVTTTADENTYTQVINDIAGIISGTVYEGIGLTGALYTLQSFAGGSPTLLGGGTMTTLQNMSRDFAAATTTIDMEGNQSNSARCVISTIGVNLTDFTAGGFWQNLFPEFKNMATAPTLLSGGTITVKIDDPQNKSGLGDGYDLNQSGGGNLMSTYAYLLTDGQVAPWMLNGNLPNGAQVKVVQATIDAQFVIDHTLTVSVSGVQTALPGPVKPYDEKTARVTLLTIPGGLYQTQTSYTPGEVIPYGLAGYIYNIEKIPQYEGTFTIQETEITDQCPQGNNLNISGGLAEWSTMQAIVQQISYDLTAGRTAITFGPAAHLGAKDLVERLRVNRNPIRPIYGIGYNLANAANSQGGAQLGNSVAQRGPTSGADNHSVLPCYANLTDAAQYKSTYLAAGSGPGAPGVTVDVTASAQPNYGNISGRSAPNAPTILIADGGSGSLTKCIRISVADLIGANKQAWFQPMSICVNVGGTPTTMTTYVLCTAPE